MLKDILENHPQIKVIDYMLACPFHEFTKQQLAVGSEISKSTLDKFIDDFLEYGLLIKKDSNYVVNLKSAYIRRLNLMLDEIIKREIRIQEQLPEEVGELPHKFDLDKSELEIKSRESYSFSADKSSMKSFDLLLI